MHIWSNLQVHRAAGKDPSKSFNSEKAAQLLTQMMKEEGLQQSSGILILRSHQNLYYKLYTIIVTKHYVASNPIDQMEFAYVLIGQLQM